MIDNCVSMVFKKLDMSLSDSINPKGLPRHR